MAYGDLLLGLSAAAGQLVAAFLACHDVYIVSSAFDFLF